MNCFLQYTPKLNPETQKPYGWVAFRTDRREWLYYLDGFSLEWRRFPKVAVSDTPRAVTRAMGGESLGAIIEQHFSKSDPEWLAGIKERISARAQLRLLDTARRNGDINWPPYDPSAGEES